VASAPSQVSIRAIAPRDLARVVNLDALHTGESKPEYWKQVFHDFLAKRTDRARVGLVAEQDGTLAGFMLADVRAFEFGSEPCGWILEVGVNPAFARRGVGSRLLAEVCQRLRAAGVTTIRTMVRRNDLPVLTFFRTNGFAGGPYVQLELALTDG
jgi:ribosomal protein S18 acetylase RimI-like enzyme